MKNCLVYYIHNLVGRNWLIINNYLFIGNNNVFPLGNKLTISENPFDSNNHNYYYKNDNNNNNNNRAEWSTGTIRIGNHVISSAIWNK